MAKGMIDVGGLHYYMDPSTGRMAANTVVDINGTNYQADGSGVLSQVQETSGSQDGGEVQSGSTPGSSQGQPGSTPDSVQTGSTPGGSQTGSTPGSSQGPGNSQNSGSSGGPGVVITGKSSQETSYWSTLYQIENRDGVLPCLHVQRRDYIPGADFSLWMHFHIRSYHILDR